MPNIFSVVEVRTNSTPFVVAWVNALRLAGIDVETLVDKLIAAVFGEGGTQVEQSSLIANTQSSGTEITGLLPEEGYQRYDVDYWIERKSDSTTVKEVGTLVIFKVGPVWNAALAWRSGNSGVSFDVDPTSGQITYSSDTVAGTYDSANSKMGWLLRTMGTAE